ncbi:hypothetical protein RN001_000081 [Aquatica leii]|uniref:Peroxisomal membrane protein 11B n=1 Tax=Aquatica leii TaxID=1421715 RepID=A0AAN7P9C2_9COLE|nr:hypothetical protein RN001_000081 [Aquatica leii]
MDTFINLNNQTAGRDRIARLLQYLSRFMWYRLEQYNKNGVHNLKRLEYQLSTFRKLLRFGRCIDSLSAALKIVKHPDLVVRITQTLSKLYNFLFLLADHILWLGRADLYQVDTDKWGKLCNRYWLYSIVMNLIRDFYEVLQVLKINSHRILPKDGCRSLGDMYKCGTKALVCMQGYQNIVIDTIKNSCDLFIPLTALGHVKLSPGTVGLLGVVSSFAGLITLIQPLAKLSPS